jgi:hypothetical protein
VLACGENANRLFHVIDCIAEDPQSGAAIRQRRTACPCRVLRRIYMSLGVRHQTEHQS